MRPARLLPALALAALLAGGCVRVYKIDVQQGNDLSERQVEALQTGMSRQEVRAALGTPLVEDPFRENRWDYVYAFKPGRSKEVERRQLTLYFDGDTLARIEGGLETEKLRAAAIDLEELEEAEQEAAKKAADDAGQTGERKVGFWERIDAVFERLEPRQAPTE